MYSAYFAPLYSSGIGPYPRNPSINYMMGGKKMELTFQVDRVQSF